jgi:hypothetical protein
MQQTESCSATGDATAMQQNDLKQAATRALERLRATNDATASGQKAENHATNRATNAPDLLHAETAKRPIVEYRFPGDPPGLWHTMLGRANETLSEAITGLRQMFPDVGEIRERDGLPADFPFKRHGDEGEFKGADGNPLPDDGPRAA